MTLRNQTVVITGASSGIGADAARQLAAKGATVCLLARSEEALAEVVASIEAAGGTAHAYPVDLTDEAATEKVAARLLAEHERIDALVNNAARSIRRPIRESVDRFHDYERTMAINYFAAVRLTLALLPRFLEQGHGHVVVSSTMSTQIPVPLFSAYVASKAALESFATSLRAEHAHAGITSTIVYFPMVRTPMSQATPIYQAMPMMSSRSAARWLVKAVARRPVRISSPFGTAVEVGMAAVPAAVGTVMTPMVRRMDKSLARKTRGTR